MEFPLPHSKTARLIANTRSGKGKGAELPDIARKLAQELGWELVVHTPSSVEEFEKESEKAVEAAEKEGGLVIAAGGDGTIRGVAQAACARDVRFAAVPIGTFNFFARAHKIPEEPEEALRLALTGECRAIRLGEVNGLVFLINASLGLYAKSIRERESATSRFGRNRFVVILSTVKSIIDGHHSLRVDLLADEKTQSLHTPMIFIGNNTLQLRNLKLDVAKCMLQDRLAVVLMKPVTKWETLRILARGVLKTLENDTKLDSYCAESLTIFTRRPSHEIALDGEIFRTTTPLRIRALPKTLQLVVPPRETKA